MMLKLPHRNQAGIESPFQNFFFTCFQFSVPHFDKLYVLVRILWILILFPEAQIIFTIFWSFSYLTIWVCVWYFFMKVGYIIP